MQAWDLPTLDAARRDADQLYHEFLSVPDLSGGLYVLEAGAVDPQAPHTEDEIYVVLAGRGRIVVGDETEAVGPGSVVFVAAGVPHRFVDITERLEVIVVFGPAEYARRG